VTRSSRHSSSSQSGSAGDTDRDINSYGEHIQQLLGRIEALPYPGAKELMQELMETILAFYGIGLRRILHVVGEAENNGRAASWGLVHDDVIKGLLLIHDLHPVDLETRLREALDKVRPYLKSHGGNVEVVNIENNVARLRLHGTCQSCASSSVTLELAVRQAIQQACPDLAGFEVENADQIEKSGGSVLPRRPVAAWTAIENATRLEEGSWMPVRIEKSRLVLCKVNGTFYAYQNRCPACNMPLDTGSLEDGVISCALDHRYDVVHAGRCAEIPSAHLEPLPLLVEDNLVKVALIREIIDAAVETISRTA